MSKPALQRWLQRLSRFSLSTLYRLADGISLIVANTPNQISRQTRANIQLCFDDLPSAERKKLVKESIRQTCYSLTELAAIWCWPSNKLLPLIDSTELCAEFETSNRGRIILAPHLGSWEMLAVWLGQTCEAMFLYKPRPNPMEDQFIITARSRSGGTPVSTKKGGLRKMLTGLSKGGSIMILPDQRPSANNASIDACFFGFNAATTALVRNLCIKVECDVFIAAMVRSSSNNRFSLNLSELDQTKMVAEQISSAQYMNDQIESLVRQFPQQYQWGYRRFDSSVYQTQEQAN